jgi:hypothetical protein
VMTIVHDPAARLRSYELLADVFQLEPVGARHQGSSAVGP